MDSGVDQRLRRFRQFQHQRFAKSRDRNNILSPGHTLKSQKIPFCLHLCFHWLNFLYSQEESEEMLYPMKNIISSKMLLACAALGFVFMNDICFAQLTLISPTVNNGGY